MKLSSPHDDIARAKRFYSAFLPALGYELEEGPAGLSYALPVQSGQSPVLPDFYVKPTFDERPASAGNGSMVAFEARNQRQVRDLHAAALFAGGSDEGQPGFRASYGPHFYVGYLRDPQGNKIALFFQRSERTRTRRFAARVTRVTQPFAASRKIGIMGSFRPFAAFDKDAR